MSIEYLEIRDINREIIGVVDTAKSIIWHSVYFGVGDFEIYVVASPTYINLLQAGRYVTRADNTEVGIIETVNVSDSLRDGTMITATGRFAKSMLDRRLIYNLSGNTNTPTILRGNVETNVRKLVSDNAINCSFDSSRNIPILELGTLSNIEAIIIDDNGNAAEKQVSYQNLLTYSDSVLQEYGLTAIVYMDTDNELKKLKYRIEQGVDRSIDNTDGLENIIFSRDFDNLTDSIYTYDTTNEKNAVLIGGEGEGISRFYSLIKPTKTGLARREMWLDASSLNKKYKDSSGTEQTYTDAQYKAMLDAQGKQTLAKYKTVETFNGTINITAGNYVLNRDFWLGDIVTVEEKNINKYVNARITETTEVQDENGYSVEAKYQ